MAKLAQIKTKKTESSVTDFIETVPDDAKKKDSYAILKMMEKLSGEKPKMWGSSLIGFGDLRYKSPATGREVDWFRIGFSPRKANFSIYLTVDIQGYAEDLKKLGKHKAGKGCLYINRLEDVDIKVLEKMMKTALKKKFE